MSWNDLLLRLRALRFRQAAESDLDDELQFHLEMEARKLRRGGMDDAAARRSARVGFGGVERTREECRDVRGLTTLENLGRDVRYGLRMLRKSPVFTAVAVLSLAIGIGANTAVFTLVNAVLLRMLPVQSPEQLVVLKWGMRKEIDVTTAYSTNGLDQHGRQSTNVFSWRTLEALRRDSRSMDTVIGFSPLWQVSVAGSGQALVTDGAVVTGNYFSGLGVPAAAGRLLASDDDTADGVPSLVISYHLWESQFGLAPDAVGKTLYINAQPCTIVGVTPKGFLGLSNTRRIDLMLPIRARDRVAGAAKQRTDFFAEDFFWLQAVGRRRAGMTDAAIEAESAAAVAANLPETARRALAGEALYVSAEPAGQGLSWMREVYRKPLLIVMAVVAITLLMACANLAGLLLARANARGREIMVRLALGAKRGRLIRQLLVEGALLSAAGAVAGVAVAWWGLRALLVLMNAGSSMPLEAAPDGRVLLFTIAVSLATTLLFALAPAVRATRVNVAHGLKQETPAVSGHRFGAVRVLVAIQIAVALPLVAGAILMSRTLANLRSVPVGFNAGNLVVFDLFPAQSGYDEARAGQLYARALDRMKQTAGIIGATVSAERLLSGYSSNGAVRIEGRRRAARVDLNFVGPEFFETMQIPIAIGRSIGKRDLTGPRIAVVNEEFARQNFRGESPLGRHFRWTRAQDMDEIEIVGVARNTRYDRIRAELPSIVYVPYTQSPWGWPQKMTMEVRTAGGQAAAVATVRRVMSGIDRALPLMDLKTQKTQIDELLVQERLFAWLISLFGAISLALAAVGLYGMIAAYVAGRTREIGVRMALGAGASMVLRMIFGQLAATAGIGVAAGLAGSWAATRVIESRLFGVKPHDPFTFVTVAAGVLLIALAAASFPARRALRIDPVRALRYE